MSVSAHFSRRQASVRMIETVNPATGEPFALYPIVSAEGVQEMVREARRVLPAWRNASFAVRQIILNRTAEALMANADVLARKISEETGKPLREAYETDLLAALATLRYMARNGPKTLRDQWLWNWKTLLLARTHRVRRLPKGVVALITPWNYPLAIAVSGMAMALMAGNTVIVKPSERAPGVVLDLVRMVQHELARRGLPETIVQIATGNGSTGQTLCETMSQPDGVDHVLFTGSNRVGRQVLALAQLAGKTASLELGGSDAMIVLDGVEDLDTVASYAIWGRFANAGQSCAAVKRLLVHRALYARMLHVLTEKMARFHVGDPLAATTHMGPLIAETQCQQLSLQVEDATERGAQLITGGFRLNRPGFFYAPTILADVPLESRVLREEVFGPVLPVVPFDTEEEAIALANQTAYGLTACVFGPRVQASRIARRLQAGTVAVNDVPLANYGWPMVPWGGWKESGPGWRHGTIGLEELTQIQVVTEHWGLAVPCLKRPPWLFGTHPSDVNFSHYLLQTFGLGKWFTQQTPAFLKALWKNRSSSRL
ncbi:MAG: aldehyde dehydrogenase family protein [Candidatus Melainabacteria bacterium]|nr:aldehyde dehydrogenase family protein [Candidatus Melainabacteria bacterium]